MTAPLWEGGAPAPGLAGSLPQLGPRRRQCFPSGPGEGRASQGSPGPRAHCSDSCFSSSSQSVFVSLVNIGKRLDAMEDMKEISGKSLHLPVSHQSLFLG